MHTCAAVLRRNSRLLEIIIVIAIIASGIALRIEDLGQWRKYEQRAFFDSQPLHTTFDAWFYLSLAQDLVDGTYAKIDERRGVPECPRRPSPPPLISVLAAATVKATGYSMSWVGALLPAVLGPLLAIPLYLLGRLYGGPITGLFAALISLFYPFYIHRSNLGRFDTDCMIITFTAAATYLFFLFGTSTTWKRYCCFAGGLLTYGLFLWWWDQAPSAVTAICALPLLVALVVYYRPTLREGIIFYGLLAGAGAVYVALKGTDVPVRMAQALWLKFLYISKDASGEFPNIGDTISEQSRPSFELILAYTTKNILGFIFAAAGLLALFWFHFRKALFLISLISLSVASFFANRFLLFLIPVLALGSGFALHMLWEQLRRFKPLGSIVCPVVAILLIWPLYSSNKEFIQWPKESGAIVAGMDVARKQTPPDAVVWAWWDHGYALTYYARRATVNDGSIHSGERTVYTAIPFATDSFRMAANFMQFYVIRGMSGMQQIYRAAGDKSRGLELAKNILAAGPEDGRLLIRKAGLAPSANLKTEDDWLRFLFPAEKRPVYLFLDRLLTKIVGWWFYFGDWNIASQSGTKPIFRPYYSVRNQGNRLVGSDGLNIDLDKGLLVMGKRAAMLSGTAVRKARRLQKQEYPQKGYRFEWFEQARFGALMDERVAETVFNKLFVRHIYPKKYFAPVQLSSPIFQLWEVHGDSFTE
ncbi:STT3 domain-containing protein [Thermodesulfobacteriota bacterium]